MPLYRYLAKASPSETVQGELHAQNADAACMQLARMGLFLMEITEVEEEAVLRGGGLARLFRGQTRAAMLHFTRQMASLLEAGMTVHSALSLVQRQISQDQMTIVVRDLIKRVQDGYPFSEACAAWPKIFSEFYVNMIRAGETGGMLALVLGHLADYLEKEDSVQKQIRAALAYPLLMVIMGMITVTILLTFVVPRIVTMFDEIGQTLPLPTRILVGVSHFFAQYWGWVLLAIGVTVLFFKIKGSQPGFRERMDRFKLRLPFFGRLILQGEITQFAQTLGALLSHGVPVHRAFEVVVAACKNRMIQDDLRNAAEAIRRGERIGVSLSAGRYLPDILAQMISIAEDTNQVEAVLERIAISGTKDVDRQVATFTRLLEPVMIMLIGGIIGFIVFAMMMPIFQIDFVVQ